MSSRTITKTRLLPSFEAHVKKTISFIQYQHLLANTQTTVTANHNQFTTGQECRWFPHSKLWFSYSLYFATNCGLGNTNTGIDFWKTVHNCGEKWPWFFTVQTYDSWKLHPKPKQAVFAPFQKNTAHKRSVFAKYHTIQVNITLDYNENCQKIAKKLRFRFRVVLWTRSQAITRIADLTASQQTL